ncbi:MAG: hypothetical protein ACRC7O_15805 [Fimbriiglobus sp.]
MAFRDFKSVDAVLREFPLELGQERLFPDTRVDVPEAFLDDLRFGLDQRTPGESEAFYTENFVYPFLRLAWRRFPRLRVWSHRPLEAGAPLSGEPDYLVADALTGVRNRMVQSPLLAVAEAKRQDFDEGWGQCLAAMLACRVLNGDRPVTVYGIVSTGLMWEFGRLDGTRFARHPDAYAVSDPALVNGMIGRVFEACGRQLPEA